MIPKKFYLPLAVLMAGVILLIVGLLSLAAPRGNAGVTASATPAANTKTIFTRGGVLALFSAPVTVTAKAEDGKRVDLLVGHAYDTSAWAATEPATEVAGLANWTTLEAKRNDAASPSTSETTELDKADVWTARKSGQGQVSITLKSDLASSAVLARCEQCKQPPSLTLHWPYRSVPVWQWTMIVLGAVTALVGVVWAALVRWPLSAWLGGQSKAANASQADLLDKSADVEELDTRANNENADAADYDEGSEPVDDEEAEIRINNDDWADEDPSKEPDAVTENIDLAMMHKVQASTGEIIVPTRRALRQARARGQEQLEIEGRLFPTGAIPTVSGIDITDQLEQPLPQESDDRVEEEIQQAREGGIPQIVIKRRRGNNDWHQVDVYRKADTDEA